MHWTTLYVLACLVGGELGLHLKRTSQRYDYSAGAAYSTGFVLWPVMLIISLICVAVWRRAVIKSVKGNVR